MTTLRIIVNYEIDVLFTKYRSHFSLPPTARVTRSDIANWLSMLVESDIMDI